VVARGSVPGRLASHVCQCRCAVLFRSFPQADGAKAATTFAALVMIQYLSERFTRALSNFLMKHPDQRYMIKAILEAQKSSEAGLYPIGAVVVDAGGNVLAVGQTVVTVLNDPTAHAEIIAIRNACSVSSDWYLPGCWLYSTLEPCPMCTSAAIWAKMEGIVFGVSHADVPLLKMSKKFARFSWRRIAITSREVVRRSPNTIALIEDFMNSLCKGLLLEENDMPADVST